MGRPSENQVGISGLGVQGRSKIKDRSKGKALGGPTIVFIFVRHFLNRLEFSELKVGSGVAEPAALLPTLKVLEFELTSPRELRNYQLQSNANTSVHAKVRHAMSLILGVIAACVVAERPIPLPLRISASIKRYGMGLTPCTKRR